MSTSYPELKKSEKLRMSLSALTSLLPVFFALAGFLIFEGGMGALIGFAVGCFSAYVAIKIIYSRVKIICPVCGSQSIRENYANSTRYSDENVEHYCPSCGRNFIDGTLCETNAT